MSISIVGKDKEHRFITIIWRRDMIVIYTQDKTYIRNNAEDAKSVLFSAYGAKLGAEAFDTVRGSRIGTAYQKYGGPLVRVVTKEQAADIYEKEKSIGMI